MHLESYITRDDETEITITGAYIPEDPQVRYYADGSGYPGYAAEIVDIKGYMESGAEHELTKDELERAEAELWQQIETTY